MNKFNEENIEKLTPKKEWETPQIIDLEAKETEYGTHGADDGAAGWTNIS